MAQLRRTHTGIDCSISEEHPKKWTISINYHLSGQSPYLAHIFRETTVDEVKSIADNEVQKSGHVCDENCKDWEAA
jgi:hypothetical protein